MGGPASLRLHSASKALRPLRITDYTHIRKGVTILIKSLLFTVLLAALALGLLACEIPAEGSPESLPASPAADAVAPTAAVTTVRVTGAVVNLRAGPSVQYEVLGQVEADDSLPVTGINADRTWLQVASEGEIRWIYADLTDVSAELRGTLAEVAALALESAASSDAGQSTSPAAEVAPVPTPTALPLAPEEIVYHAPGTYDRSLYPGLRYEWELVFTDNSELWDWTIADFQGCYDALRVYMDDEPEKRGLKRLEIVLSDPYTDRDLLNYEPEHFTRDLSSFYPTVPMDQEELLRNWPDWHEGNLPHPDFAYTRAVCQQPGGPDVQVCNLHPLWGKEGSVFLDGSATKAMAAGAGIAMLGAGPHRAWLDQRYIFGSTLVPLDTRIGDPAGHGPCIRLKKT